MGLLNRATLYFLSVFFQPLVYVMLKKYRRGLIVQGIGIFMVMTGMMFMNQAFMIDSPTMQYIVIGTSLIFFSFGFTVYDCIKVIRLESKHFIKA